MNKIILLQCLLCSFLLIISVFLCLRTSGRSVSAGTFESSYMYNDTFEDFSKNCFSELFYE